MRYHVRSTFLGLHLCECVGMCACTQQCVCGVPLFPLRFPSIHAYVYACMHVSMYVYMSVCLYVCTYVSIFVCFVCMHAFIRVYAHFFCLSVGFHAYMPYMYACMHACIHARMIACMCGGIEINAYSYPYAQKDSQVSQLTASHKRKECHGVGTADAHARTRTRSAPSF